MRRKRRLRQSEPDVGLEDAADFVNFDDVLSRELDAPTVIELDQDMAIAPSALADSGLAPTGDGPTSDPLAMSTAGGVPAPTTIDATVDATEAENALLRAELLATPAVSSPHPITPSSPIVKSAPAASPGLPTATAASLATSPAPAPALVDAERTLPEGEVVFEPPVQQPELYQQPQQRAPIRSIAGFEQYDFWDRYEEATASAELFAVPPAAITTVIGALDVAVAVAERCQSSHWVSECDVYVLTEREHIDGQPTWTTVRRPSDVVAVLEGGESDFPLLVLDIPRELPAWVRPLVARLRTGGVGLVHYVLGEDPSDEDLATWHGELGRPAVLDLASPVAPDRVLELLDRGEPVASVAGMPISTELLMALRLNNC